MSGTKVSEVEFMAAWHKTGSPQGVSDETGLDIRQVYKRRKTIEQRRGIILAATTDATGRSKAALPKNGIRRIGKLINGRALIFNDGHIWPGRVTVAMKALLVLAKELKPDMVICNGDIFAGPHECRAVGFLLHKTDKVVIVVPHISGDQGDGGAGHTRAVGHVDP